MRLRPEQHDTLAAAIGRRDWTRARTDFERATLVLERMSGLGVEHVTPAQLAVAMGCMPLNAQDICHYADMACALAMVMPKTQLQSVNADLLKSLNEVSAALNTAQLVMDAKSREYVREMLSRVGAVIAKATGARA